MQMPDTKTIIDNSPPARLAASLLFIGTLAISVPSWTTLGFLVIDGPVTGFTAALIVFGPLIICFYFARQVYRMTLESFKLAELRQWLLIGSFCSPSFGSKLAALLETQTQEFVAKFKTDSAFRETQMIQGFEDELETRKKLIEEFKAILLAEFAKEPLDEPTDSV